ncbi:hypothetical protein [Ochrobactrum sp. AN78]|uniref:hypothetical protein n=1 Tax=Ochrobactrum sp. AN78 TaxID=3039853 RepID=UPI002989E9CA|nr:hypothetical protein [Ochrobactrum sp. AN78]MDH7791998.1 hypothetical protein [Ochrobactrum sp. AN78]
MTESRKRYQFSYSSPAKTGLQTSGSFELVYPLLASAAAFVPHRFTLLKDDDVVERAGSFT